MSSAQLSIVLPSADPPIPRAHVRGSQHDLPPALPRLERPWLCVLRQFCSETARVFPGQVLCDLRWYVEFSYRHTDHLRGDSALLTIPHAGRYRLDPMLCPTGRANTSRHTRSSGG